MDFTKEQEEVFKELGIVPQEVEGLLKLKEQDAQYQIRYYLNTISSMFPGGLPTLIVRMPEQGESFCMSVDDLKQVAEALLETAEQE